MAGILALNCQESTVSFDHQTVSYLAVSVSGMLTVYPDTKWLIALATAKLPFCLLVNA